MQNNMFRCNKQLQKHWRIASLFEVMKLASSPTILHCLFALKLDVGHILQYFATCFLLQKSSTGIGSSFFGLGCSKPAACLCKLESLVDFLKQRTLQKHNIVFLCACSLQKGPYQQGSHRLRQWCQKSWDLGTSSVYVTIFCILGMQVALRYMESLVEPTSMHCTCPLSYKCLIAMLIDLISPDGRPSAAVQDTK